MGEVRAGAGEERLVGFVHGPERFHLPLDLSLQRGYWGEQGVLAYNGTKTSGVQPPTVPVYRAVRIRIKGEHRLGQVAIKLEQPGHRARHGLLLDVHEVHIVLVALEAVV